MSEQEPPQNPEQGPGAEEKPDGWQPKEWQPRWEPQYEPTEPTAGQPTGQPTEPTQPINNPYVPPAPQPEPTQPLPPQQPYTGWTQPGPQQPYSQQPGQPHGQQPYGQPQWQPGYPAYTVPDDPGAQTSMLIGVLALASMFFCLGIGLIGSPFAMVMGLRSKRRIDAAGGALGGRGNAQAGFVLGLIGTVFLVLAVLAVIGLVAVLASVDWSETDTTYGNA